MTNSHGKDGIIDSLGGGVFFFSFPFSWNISFFSFSSSGVGRGEGGVGGGWRQPDDFFEMILDDGDDVPVSSCVANTKSL